MIIKDNEALYKPLFAKAYQTLKSKNLLRDEFYPKGEKENAMYPEGASAFLSIHDYFSHMADLMTIDPVYMMLPLDETSFDINANSRAISAPKIVVLQKDHIAETIVFTIDRYFDYMDLNNAEIWVQWTAPGKNGTVREGKSRISMRDISTIPGKIRLGWTLEDDITAEPGTVKYSVRFWNKGIITDDKGVEHEKVVYSFNTLTSSLTITPSLQPEIDFDEVPNDPLRDNIFKRAIRNSQITIEGVAVPLDPSFSDPGKDLDSEASLTDDTLTLRAQAVVGDTGHVEYEWYYKPAVNVTVNGIEFNSNTAYSYEPKTIENADGTTITVPGFKEFKGTVIEKYEPVTGLTALVNGEQYYVEASDTSTGYAAYTGTSVPDNITLYERFTTYTVPAGEVKVTGDYYVQASNYIRPNTSHSVPSTTCKLISPDDVVFTTNLPEGVVIEGAGADLSVKLAKQSSEFAKISYTWKKGTDSNVADEDIADAVSTSNSYTVASPGWYQVTAKASLNREDKTATSSVCKVTFMPEIPAMSYGAVSQAIIDGGSVVNLEDGIKAPLYGETDGTTITLDLNLASVIPADYADYSENLFSEEMVYAWGVQIGENAFRYLTDADIGVLVESGLGTPTLVVKSPAGTTQHMFKCIVSNKLNGKMVTCEESNALPFYVM